MGAERPRRTLARTRAATTGGGGAPIPPTLTLPSPLPIQRGGGRGGGRGRTFVQPREGWVGFGGARETCMGTQGAARAKPYRAEGH